GNGRCNLSNEHISPEFYFGSCAKHLHNVWEQYNCDFIRKYFSDLGLLTVSDNEGRIYPVSNSASSVLECMRNYYHYFGNVDELCNTVVKTIKSGYLLECIRTDNDTVRISAKYVVLACGGKSSPKLSTDGLGYDLLNTLHIRTSVLFPSLVPITCNDKLLNLLKGVRIKGNVSLMIDGNIVARHNGEIQFTEKALSGICVFQLSRLVNEYFMSKKQTDIKIALDILPQFSKKECKAFLVSRVQHFGKYTLDNLFDGLLQKKIALTLYRKCGITDLNRKSATLNKKEIQLLSDTLKQWEFIPTSASSFENAQITAGGIISSEIDFTKMESVRYKHLYFGGEIIDIDGLCGGYNLHWAWCSGIIVARAIGG
ncbi:MAG: aminoacetone oxidase family FAD-binding enzyme, partial [Clostridia bacterium]|nr:aminoacetone oxidase family FAD-binding enzyme [Clostridia bacterium]